MITKNLNFLKYGAFIHSLITSFPGNYFSKFNEIARNNEIGQNKEIDRNNEKAGNNKYTQKPKFSSEFGRNSFCASMRNHIKISCNFYSKCEKICANIARFS